MQLNNLHRTLKEFGNYVVQQSRTRLTKAKKGGSSLYKKVDFEIDPQATSILVKFPFLQEIDYAKFVDQGVKGKNPSKISPNAKIKGQQAPMSPYKFGSGTKRGTFKKFSTIMAQFAKKRNIRFRDEKGRFKAGGYKSMGYVIASNIYNRGLAPTFFFSKSFETGVDKFQERFFLSFLQDIDDNLEL